MSLYMDREGFLRKDLNDSRKQIRRAEKWIREFLARGASIPEAMWSVKCTFDAAFENVRYDLVQQNKKKRTRK